MKIMGSGQLCQASMIITSLPFYADTLSWLHAYVCEQCVYDSFEHSVSCISPPFHDNTGFTIAQNAIANTIQETPDALQAEPIHHPAPLRSLQAIA